MICSRTLNYAVNEQAYANTIEHHGLVAVFVNHGGHYIDRADHVPD